MLLDSPYVVSYWRFISNIWPNLVPLRDIRLQNHSDLDVDLSRSLKVRCDGAIGLPIYGFLLTVNSNIWSNSAHLRDIRFWNLSDLDLSRSLKVKYEGVTGLPIYAFLLMVNTDL